ncbi:MAG: hypothetical protein M9962_09425 [Oligoflexia bacterium]|nr:hypothetical protein [Oligoflexia bacterium]
MNFLIIGDSLKNLKPKTDTSLALAKEALSRGHEVSWIDSKEIFFWEGRVFGYTSKITHCHEGTLPATETNPEPEAINSFDGVWIRKDPPFDLHYQALCSLLSLEEENTPFMNKPSLLLRYHEKLLPFEAYERGFLEESELIPTYLSLGNRIQTPQNFPKGQTITKPFDGHGGKGVTLHPSIVKPETMTMLQPLQAEVRDSGDRRIFYLDGEVIGSFVRLPKEGEIKSNIASGGLGILKDMSAKEKNLADRLGEFLKERGIVFAGADMINCKISEVNITSPTGFLTYKEIGGPSLTGRYLEYAENQL